MNARKCVANVVPIAVVLAAGLGIAGLGVTSGCNDAVSGALSGAALGTGAGAILGSLEGEAGKGMAIGAVSGALIGGVIGDQNARRERERLEYERAEAERWDEPYDREELEQDLQSRLHDYQQR